MPTDPENVDTADVDAADVDTATVDPICVLSVDCPGLIFGINANKGTSK